jgi:hypothetical protein
MPRLDLVRPTKIGLRNLIQTLADANHTCPARCVSARGGALRHQSALAEEGPLLSESVSLLEDDLSHPDDVTSGSTQLPSGYCDPNWEPVRSRAPIDRRTDSQAGSEHPLTSVLLAVTSCSKLRLVNHADPRRSYRPNSATSSTQCGADVSHNILRNSANDPRVSS